ncbi:glycerol-3-phosphate acyltransferase [Gloeocapsa sp. PCC 73106]|uniref:glycerol-3-phosphate acyltransferase n=1 Tax=Gloeocapsa sp. PCC 73106 TaxID=102232 RepID=UPI0002ABB078|nr:glycerol-3-phosphate acyltransferase [Gloeocapsa sp. PCC 73106]ELR98355.1 phosphoenolpyruvate synthase/pyruvate phosphate dikinase [Gloeocapsa sp. PCC 73106]
MKIIPALLVIGLSFALGAFPLINWISYYLSGKKLNHLGTGNISVSAAFYHGGKLIGILAVLSEAIKGVGVVWLARILLPGEDAGEIVALIALVLGRYFVAQGAGTTNVFWGMIAHDLAVAVLTLVCGGVSFSLWRRRQSAKILVLVWLVVIMAWRHWSQPALIIATVVLCLLLGWIYQRIPDDLDLSTQKVNPESAQMFRFLQGKNTQISLKTSLNPREVGQKAANLAQLLSWGYRVPDGLVLRPEDDPESLVADLTLGSSNPLVVRSSAVGEDSDLSSAAGQYKTVLNITNREDLVSAIAACRESYNNPVARQYRQDQGQIEQKMAVIIQKQINGVFSGVAFSRDPLNQGDGAVVIEALPGDASQVVSGKITPESYRIVVKDSPRITEFKMAQTQVIEAIAQIAREVETLYHGIPQDLEWTYDGEYLWLLQTRPITTLQPMWTRKIAAEVIPGVIKPLTWSINRPLTCGVWGEIFTLVLGKRAEGLDFEATATLHWGRAYFNATLLGDIFRRMGLPPESLEFLTRGAKMSRPPLAATWQNLPGLGRLLVREWNLVRDFERDDREYFQPFLANLPSNKGDLTEILALLKRATYYSILAPLSLALRQGILKVEAESLDSSVTPEVASVRSLAQLATEASLILPNPLPSDLFNYLSQTTEGKKILLQFEQLLSRYGYLSETATDISVPRWCENPSLVRNLFSEFFVVPQPTKRSQAEGLRVKIVQQRLNLKGRVTEVYSQLLAQLRWSFLVLGEQWVKLGQIEAVEEIFWLEYAEIVEIRANQRQLDREIIQKRKSEWLGIKEITAVPYLVYGNHPQELTPRNYAAEGILTGIGASPGEKTGIVKIVLNFDNLGEINSEMILVVPYTDSGWGAFLARAGGIIAEAGGRLSHGAIIAREYGIPAVMDVHDATRLLKDGQRVRINGQRGVVEVLV